jgi:aldehyde:ferredoxin oxidoreductase
MLDPLKPEEQVEASRGIQIVNAAFDSTGLCFMVYVALLSPEVGEVFLKVLNAKLGTALGPEDFPGALGVRVLKAEKEFNRKAGFTKDDDRLPWFYYEEPLPPHNTVFSITDQEIDSTFDF